MKSFEGLKGTGMSERGARKFLTESKSTLLLGTTDEDGAPTIHPVWYYFDSMKTKLYFYTEPALRKTVNIKKRDQVYFDVDDDKWPYRGVKGRGRARILTSKRQALSFGEKILLRYVKKGLPLFNNAMERIRKGGYIVVEIIPAYFTSWDFSKLEVQTSNFRPSIIST